VIQIVCIIAIFHGTPDIIIEKRKEDIQAVLQSSENPSSSSNEEEEDEVASMSPYATVENSIQSEKVLYVDKVPLIDKTGKLQICILS